MEQMKASDISDVIAVISLSIGLFMSIYFDQKDLALMLGGALGGVVGMSTKNNNNK